MIISYKHKTIFFHNPKTGGASINHRIHHATAFSHEVGYLKNPNIHPFISDINRHFNPNDYLDKISQDEFGMEVFNTFFKFAFIRNPFDRLVSLYSYLQQKEWHNKEHFNKTYTSFDMWVRCIYTQYKAGNKSVGQSMSPQHVWTHRDGKQVVDFIGRFEKYEEDFKTIADTIGLEYDKSVITNVTKHDKYQAYYDNVTKRRVSEIFAEDIELYGYTF